MDRVYTDSPGRPTRGGLRGRLAVLTAAAAVGLLAWATPASAQAGAAGIVTDTIASGTGNSRFVTTVTGPERRSPTRAELEARLERLRSRLGSDDWAADRKEVRQAAAELARRLEERLSEGDFRPGDLLAIRVPGYPSSSGKVMVGPDREIDLPGFEGVSVDLSGLLYSEARGAVTEAFAKYIRADRVEVQPLIRVAVLGAVGRPGYYDAAPTVPLAELLMAAGGPGGQSRLDDLQVKRNGENLLNDRDVPLTQLTLLDLDARHGDQVVVPAQGSGFDFRTFAGIIGATSGIIWGISRIF